MRYRSSVKTQLNEPREIEMDICGSCANTKEAPSNHTTNLPSVLMKGFGEVSGSIANNSHLSAIDELASSIPSTETLILKGTAEYPVNEKRRVTP